MHIFARRVTRYAGLSGSGVCREKATKAADKCGNLGNGWGEELDWLRDKAIILRASDRARLDRKSTV